MSCKKAQEFLEKEQVTTEAVVDARKIRIEADEAWALLKTAKAITAAKGKKIVRFKQAVEEKEAILRQVMGPSGNLRAPTYRMDDEFIVGFNVDFYTDWLK
ncbi:MAG: ArsC family (seleno)protein [Desulfuromusa sp.]|jgi:arsenate reductase-like glutaredoxin family protein|nr:ArsC family (seleno)protein [Desulfuromusa sp.]